MKRILFILIIGLSMGCASETVPAPEIDIDATAETEKPMFSEEEVEVLWKNYMKGKSYTYPPVIGTTYKCSIHFTRNDGWLKEIRISYIGKNIWQIESVIPHRRTDKHSFWKVYEKIQIIEPNPDNTNNC